MKVFIVQGEHWYVSGLSMSAFAGMDRANAEAASLVNILLKDIGLASDASADNWQARLDLAHANNDGDGNVWITELELQ